MAKIVSREKEREKDKPKSGTKTVVKGKPSAGGAKVLPAAKTTPAAAKTPAKAPAAKAPVTKTAATKAPVAKAPAAKPPAAVAKASAPVKAPVPAAKAPASAKAPVPAAKAPVSAAKAAPKEAVKTKERDVARVVKEVIKYKCPMPASELKQWREVLLSRRGEITNDIEGLVKDAMDAEDGHTTPNHIAERGSDADLQDMSLCVVGEEKEVVWQIDRALRKIDAAKPIPFGLCEFTKEPIPKTRLQLIPWTPLSIEGATHMEKNALTLEDVLADE